jgi:dihydroflavonol-4-reductase
VALAARGDRLVCLARDTTRARVLEKLGAEIVQGDINDDIALRRGFERADIAYHVAGVYDTGVVDEGSLERGNVDGTRAFLQFATHAQVPRAVYVSTAAALGPTEADDADDNDWRGPYPSVYHRTKTQAHRMAKDAQARGLPLIIVCPTFVFGPADTGPGGRFLSDLLRRRLPGLLRNPSTFSYVHVDDIAAGLVAAGERGRPGTNYVLGGERLSVNQFAERVCAYAGVKAPTARFPTAIARMSAMALDLVTRVTRVRFSLSRENVDSTCCRPWSPGWSRAAAELGYAPRPLDEVLPETIAWYREHTR